MSRANKFLPSNLRDMNRKRVFDMFIEKKELSKAEIAAELNTSVQTITKIFDFLLENNYICCLGEANIPKGRPPQIYGICPDSINVLTIIFEGNYIRISLVNIVGDVVSLEQMKYKGDLEEILAGQICDISSKIISEETLKKNRIIGIGIGIPGVVDSEEEIISLAPHIGIDLPRNISSTLDKMREELKLPIFIENDVNAAAFGEYNIAKAKVDDLVFISLGTGLGSGIILNGQLRTGEKNQAGEIGYLVRRGDTKTYEEIIGLAGLKERWGFDPHTPISEMDERAYKEMTDAIVEILVECTVHFAIQLDISLFIFGGMTLQILGNEFIDRIQKAVTPLIPFSVNIKLQNSEEPGNVGMGKHVVDNKIYELMGAEDVGNN